MHAAETDGHDRSEVAFGRRVDSEVDARWDHLLHQHVVGAGTEVLAHHGHGAADVVGPGQIERDAGLYRPAGSTVERLDGDGVADHVRRGDRFVGWHKPGRRHRHAVSAEHGVDLLRDS